MVITPPFRSPPAPARDAPRDDGRDMQPLLRPRWLLVVLALDALRPAAVHALECQGHSPPTGRCSSEHVRFASSSNTIYISGAVACRPTDLADTVPASALRRVDPDRAVWQLRADITL